MKKALMKAFNENDVAKMRELITSNPQLANVRFRKSGDKLAPSDPLIYHALCKLNRAMVELLEPHATGLNTIDIARLDDRAKKFKREGRINSEFKQIIDCICSNNAIKCKRIPSDLSSRSASHATVFAPTYGSMETLKTDGLLVRDFSKKEPKRDSRSGCCTIC